MSIEQIYERFIKVLPASEQRRLIQLIQAGWDAAPSNEYDQKAHRLMELHGFGKEIWQQVDVQDYIEQLRSEWRS